MDLGESIFRELSGGRASRSGIGSFGGAIDWLLGHAGSASAAARAVGVPPSTMRHWTGGRQPKAARAGAVFDAALRAQRQAWLGDREDLARNGWEEVEVEGTLSISDDEVRALVIACYPGLGDELVDAFLGGAGPAELESIFLESVADPWYRDALSPNGFGDGPVWDTDRLDGGF